MQKDSKSQILTHNCVPWGRATLRWFIAWKINCGFIMFAKVTKCTRPATIAAMENKQFLEESKLSFPQEDFTK